MPRIEALFNSENERFKSLIAKEHDRIGRVLKAHLIIENYLTRHLESTYDIKIPDEAKLSFFQKAQLLPVEGAVSTFVRPGLISLNKVRNKLAHNLENEIQLTDIEPIIEILSYSRPGIHYDDPYTAIEAFTVVACAFLIASPPELQHAIVVAFQSIRLAVP
jgi:hypothetical protein